MFNLIIFLIFVTGFVNCGGNNSHGKLTFQSKSIQLCDSGLWLKKFELVFYERGYHFDSIIKVISKARQEVDFFVLPRNNCFFRFSEIDCKSDFILKIYSQDG